MLFLVLKNKNYSKLYGAGLISELLSLILETAIMILVFELSQKSSSWPGIAKATFLFSLTMGSFLGGPLGQIFNRKRLLIWCYLIRLPALFLFLYFDQLLVIIALNMVIAFSIGVFNPSRQAVINEIVSFAQIKQANSLFGLSIALVQMLAPFLGATLFVTFRGISELVSLSFLTYLLAIVLLLSIRYVPIEQEKKPINTFLSELVNGLNYMKRRKDLMAILFNSFFAGLCVGVLIPLLLPYSTKIMGLTESFYGVLLSSFGAGGLIGGLVSKYLNDRFPSGKLIVFSVMCEPIFLFLWLFSTTASMQVFIFILWGIAVFIRVPSQLNYISESVPTHYLTRCHSLLDLSFIMPSIIGGAMVGIFGDYYSAKTILFVIGCIFFLAIFLRLKTQSVQDLYYSRHEKIVR